MKRTPILLIGLFFFAGPALALFEENGSSFDSATNYFASLDRTQEQYDECYASVHGRNLMLEGRTFKNWQRLLEQAQGVNDDSVAAPLIVKCKPFLSEDYLTWTARLPGESNAPEPLATQSGYTTVRFNEGIRAVSNYSGNRECANLSFNPFLTSSDGNKLITNWTHIGNGPSGEIQIEIVDGVISGSMSSPVFDFPTKAEVETRSSDLRLKFDVLHERGQCWLSFELTGVISRESNLTEPRFATGLAAAASAGSVVTQAGRSIVKTRAKEQDCSDDFHKHGGLDWRRAVAANLADGPVDDIDLNRCKHFVSADYLTWTASPPSELQEQPAQANQIATISKVWCVTKHKFWSVSKFSTCGSAKVFTSRYQAEFEHQRLKGIASVSAPQPTPQPARFTTVDNSALDLEFWQSIKDSNNRNMFREYLRQFPSGVYAGLAKINIKKLGGDTTVVNASIPNLDYGDYYALVIGNNDYQDLTKLTGAVNDAKAVSTVLEVDYGFNVKLLENASRKDILRSLKHLRETVSAKDNVLIYYAGHGYLDEAADQGYWLPVDSERDDDSNWIATDRVAGQIKAMQAKHVMVVADSCFSGTITRAIKIEQRTPEWLSEIVKKKARTALTSGGLEPVMDTGSGNHSAFAYAFISLLEKNDGVLDASQLFSKLRPKVMVNSTQTPQYGKIHMAGDDGGDFLFVRQ